MRGETRNFQQEVQVLLFAFFHSFLLRQPCVLRSLLHLRCSQQLEINTASHDLRNSFTCKRPRHPDVILPPPSAGPSSSFAIADSRNFDQRPPSFLFLTSFGLRPTSFLCLDPETSTASKPQQISNADTMLASSRRPPPSASF